MTIKVKFRGVRGSYPTPRSSHLKYGGNTSCVEVIAGDKLIILDAGTGITELGENLTREHILSGNTEAERIALHATVILSHIHQDHIQGLPFFSPIFTKSTELKIYGPDTAKEKLKDSLTALLFDKSFPVSLDEIHGAVDINSISQRQALIIKESGEHVLINVSDFDETKVGEKDVVINVFKTMAHPKNGCLCVKIQYEGKTIVYATDKECYVGSDKKFIEFAYGCDILIHDAQYTHQDYISPIMPKQGYGHSTFNMAIETAKLAKAKKLYFFHYDPNYDDTILDMLEKDFNNMTVDFNFSKEKLEIVL
ncbi:MAG: MBL fold metallo-hydrolase [Candidatus Gastranaerophilales bacterium]|nr:MBL fold metallo-hydrolase [Candidatus Gastranaerophilales bacterium]